MFFCLSFLNASRSCGSQVVNVGRHSYQVSRIISKSLYWTDGLSGNNIYKKNKQTIFNSHASYPDRHGNEAVCFLIKMPADKEAYMCLILSNFFAHSFYIQCL